MMIYVTVNICIYLKASDLQLIVIAKRQSLPVLCFVLLWLRDTIFYFTLLDFKSLEEGNTFHMRSHKSAKEVLWPCGVWFLSTTSCGCLDQVPMLEKEPSAVKDNRGELWKLDHYTGMYSTGTKMCAPVNTLKIINPTLLLIVLLVHAGTLGGCAWGVNERDWHSTHTQIEEVWVPQLIGSTIDMDSLAWSIKILRADSSVGTVQWNNCHSVRHHTS